MIHIASAPHESPDRWRERNAECGTMNDELESGFVFHSAFIVPRSLFLFGGTDLARIARYEA
jgi:hypothetical protein